MSNFQELNEEQLTMVAGGHDGTSFSFSQINSAATSQSITDAVALSTANGGNNGGASGASISNTNSTTQTNALHL